MCTTNGLQEPARPWWPDSPSAKKEREPHMRGRRQLLACYLRVVGQGQRMLPTGHSQDEGPWRLALRVCHIRQGRRRDNEFVAGGLRHKQRAVSKDALSWQ